MAKAKILITEDERIVARDIAARLKHLGYATVAAASGAEALAVADETHPDLALMDIRLKGNMDGIETAGELRKQLSIPIVYLTAHADERTLERAKLTEPLGYLLKPFTDRELQTCINVALYKHEAEARLKKSEAWCRSILTCIADAVIVTDTKGIISFFNPAAAQMVATSLEEAKGKRLSEVFTMVTEDKRTPIRLSVTKAIREEATFSASGHAVLISKDNTETHVDESVAPMRDEHGNTSGLVLVFRDVTERYMLGKQMSSRQKMEAIGTLSRGIAHDFGNIAGVITGYASSMVDSLLLGTKGHEDALRILEAGKHARELTNRLVSVARASEPGIDQAVEPISPADVIRDTTELLQATLTQRSIRIDVLRPEKMPYVMADASQMLDVLMNLMLNAADAMAKGGVITISASARQIDKPNVKLNPKMQPGPYVALRIRDSGCGMARDVLDHIFEPFYTTKATGGAQGLGLTIAHGTVQAWGGWIRVRSAPGKGTTVSVYIPQAEMKLPQDQEAEPVGAVILLVDNDDNDLATSEEVLTNAGHKVYKANTVDNGLELYRKHGESIAVSVVDLVMPGKDGKEFVEQLLLTNPEAGIVMTSGFSRDYVRTYLGHGGWGFVQKPVEAEALLEVIGRALS